MKELQWYKQHLTGRLDITTTYPLDDPEGGTHTHKHKKLVNFSETVKVAG